MFEKRILFLLACALNYDVSVAMWSCSGDSDCAMLTGSVCRNSECVCPAGTQNVLGGTACVQPAPYHTSACYDDFQCSRLFTNFECRRSANSLPTEAGQCFCQAGHHYFRGRCWPSTPWGEQCNSNEECMYVLRDPFSMMCHDGSCGCSPGYYLRQRGECRKSALAVGDACVIDEDCQFEGGTCQISTLTCVSESPTNEDVTGLKSDFAASPTTSVEEKSKVVASLAPFIETRQHGVVCSDNNDCISPFQCSSLGVCICPLGYYPNAAGTICLAEMGSPVTSTDQCVGMFTEVRDGICRCQVNFFFDEAMRGCVKPAIRLEDFCFNDDTCHTFGIFARCVYTGPWGLHSCECIPGETVWNEQRRICALFSGIGESCEVDSDCIAGDLEIQCVKNDEGVGVCSCPEGLVAMDGLCLQINQDLGDTCQVDIECSDVDNAVCASGICTCGNGYQQIGDICAPEIGGTCVESADCIIENTICEKATNTCRCSPEFVASAISCWPAVPGYGSSCNVTDQCAAALGEAGVCVNNECVCHEQYHFRDEQCWIKTGIFEACSRSSVCFLEGGSHRLECRNSLCQCTFDYPYIHGEGTCSTVSRSNAAMDHLGNYKILMASLLYLYYS